MKNAVINYRAYEDGVGYLGDAEVTLPELSRITAEIKGAGINGTVQDPIVGHFEAMSMTINFNAPSKEQSSLFEGRKHRITLKAAVQGRDDKTSEVTVTPVKYVIECTPAKLTNGKLAPASTSDASGEYNVTYYSKYVDGKKIDEIDLFNFIAIINGKDELSQVRNALGLN